MDILKIVLPNYLAALEGYARKLMELAKETPEGCVVECGVARGGSAAVIIDAFGKDRKFYLCDSYDGFPAPDPIDLETPYIRNMIIPGCGKINPEYVANTLKLAGITDLSNVEFVKGFFKDSMPELAKRIEPIAFLHFDGDFYQSALDVFDNLQDKIVDGGIIVLHDYPNFTGMKKFIEERWTKEEINIIPTGGCYIINKYKNEKKYVKDHS